MSSGALTAKKVAVVREAMARARSVLPDDEQMRSLYRKRETRANPVELMIERATEQHGDRVERKGAAITSARRAMQEDALGRLETEPREKFRLKQR